MLNLSKVFRFYTNNRSLSALYIFADIKKFSILEKFSFQLVEKIFSNVLFFFCKDSTNFTIYQNKKPPF